jgi:sugar-specific transcriptional regulator TrmB
VAKEDGISALNKLGFSTLEAEIYTALLQEAPVTGYRIAQTIGKPIANVYKAVEALEAKGAVLVDEGKSRLCRPVPVAELLSRMDRNFQSLRLQAAQTLTEIENAPRDSRIYQLRTRDQVFERCRAMLGRAQQTAIFDVFPYPLQVLRPEVEEAVARGVEVVAKVFQPTTIPGVATVLNGRNEEMLRKYPGEWITLSVDGSELLIACLAMDRPEVHQAFWTTSIPMSWFFHAHLTLAIRLFVLSRAIIAGAPGADLQAAANYILESDLQSTPDSPELVKQLAGLNALTSTALPGYEAIIAEIDPSST